MNREFEIIVTIAFRIQFSTFFQWESHKRKIGAKFENKENRENVLKTTRAKNPQKKNTKKKRFIKKKSCENNAEKLLK